MYLLIQAATDARNSLQLTLSCLRLEPLVVLVSHFPPQHFSRGSSRDLCAISNRNEKKEEGHLPNQLSQFLQSTTCAY